MLVIKAFVGPSRIHGTGLFAAQKISKGDTVWKFSPALDLLFTPAEFEALPDVVKADFLLYSYFNQLSGHYVYCADNSKFVNHSSDPNTMGVYPEGDLQGFDMATRDIDIGEEITCDYTTFDGDFVKKLGEQK